jgi:hypothetical protein
MGGILMDSLVAHPSLKCLWHRPFWDGFREQLFGWITWVYQTNSCAILFLEEEEEPPWKEKAMSECVGTSTSFTDVLLYDFVTCFRTFKSWHLPVPTGLHKHRYLVSTVTALPDHSKALSPSHFMIYRGYLLLHACINGAAMGRWGFPHGHFCRCHGLLWLPLDPC